MIRELPGTRARGFAVGWVAVPTILAVSGLALSLHRPTVEDLVDGHEIGDATMAIACGIVAFIIVSRLPRHPVGLVFGVIGGFDGLTMLASGCTDALHPAHGHGSGAYTWALWSAEWSWVPGLVLAVTVLPLVFPDGVTSRRQRLLMRADIATVVALCVAQACSPTLQSGLHTSVPNPLAVPGADAAEIAVAAVAVGCVLLSIGTLVLRLVQADALLRRQIVPFFAAGALIVVALCVANPLGPTGVVIQDTSLVLLPCAALLSVLRLRLYDLELAIRRTLVWVLLSGLLVGVYVLVVQVAANLLRLHGRPSSVLATAVIAIAFGPLRLILQKAVARWLYGDRGDPYSALSHTTQVLSGSADPAGALGVAVDDLARRLRCPGVRIVRDGVVLAGAGDGVAGIAVPLISGSVEVGRLEVLPRSPGERFSRSDERLILDLCAPLTNAVAAVGMTEDLRASRERLAVAREEERRRVRSELHDDIGPSLAAVAVQAQTALRRIERDDTAAAVSALRSLQVTTTRASSDLRSVIDALGPRALDEVGLHEAVQELAATLIDDAIDVRLELDIPASHPLPAAVEVAVYRVIAEALTNTGRHAQADQVLVSLYEVDGVLALVVADNGTGHPSLTRPGGVGVPSMRARVEEVGGRLDCDSGSSGTRISARIPLNRAVDQAAVVVR